MGLSLLDALQMTEDSLRPFAIRFVSYDHARKKGGEIIVLKDCVRIGASHNMKDNDTISVKRHNADRHPYTVHIHMILSINEQEIFC